MINRKGGVGKTTSAVNISAALALLGKRVLLVDTDTQAHATLSLGVTSPEFTLLEVLLDGARGAPLQVRENLFLVPSSSRLSDFEVEAVKKPRKMIALRHFLDAVAEEFDFAVLDAPPSLGVIVLSGLLAAEEAIVPMPPHFLALKGLAETKALIDKVSRKNPALRLAWILPTFFNPQLRHTREVMQEIEKVFGRERILPPIKNSVRLTEAPALSQTIFEYAPRSPLAEAYMRVANIILEGGAS